MAEYPHRATRLLPLLAGGVVIASLLGALAQQGPRPGGPPRPRQHTAIVVAPLSLVPADHQPPAPSAAEFESTGAGRQVRANGLPDHAIGAFPNRGNPNPVTAQGYDLVIPADPKPAARASSMRGPFGIALNGVMFDPGAAEFWRGDPSLGWTYEALGGAVPLGIDENHAHVQPSGAYHYHGLPTLYLKQRGVAPDRHSPQIGWAADGYPIYALHGYRDARDADSGVTVLRSSYRLKAGDRPAAPEGPGGRHDGAFVQDYEYVEGHGDLDECNGRFGITPEYPEGTYAYFLTGEWPVIPRLFRGTPVPLREEPRGPGPGGNRPPRPGPGGGGPPFPR